MSSYIAAYDISHNSSRTKVARVLKQYGIRIQRSVFQIEVSKSELSQIKRDVGPFLGSDDRFDLIPIHVVANRPKLSWQFSLQQETVVFL